MKRLRWILGIVALTLVILGVWAFVQDWNGRHRLRAVLANLDATEPRWRLKELDDDHASPPDHENVIVAVAAISRKIPQGWSHDPNRPERSLDELLEGGSPNRLIESAVVDELAKHLQDIQNVVTEARQLDRFSTGKATINWAPDFISTLFPHIDHNRSVIHVLQFEAIFQANRGDAESALKAIRAAIAVLRGLENEPALISQMFRAGLRDRLLGTLHTLCNLTEGSSEDLGDLQMKLEAEGKTDLFKVGMRGERACIHHFFQALEDEKISVHHLGSLVQFEKASLLPPAVDGARAMLSRHAAHAFLLDRTTQVLKTADLPYQEQKEILNNLIEAAKTGFPPIAEIWLRNHRVIAERFRRNDARLRTAMVGLAAERYRLKHGAWPKQLNDLVPAYLERVPIDPFTENELSYRRLEDGIVVYSVGPEGKHDGLFFSRKVATHQPPGYEDRSLEFRLWNPNHRRLPPEEKKE